MPSASIKKLIRYIFEQSDRILLFARQYFGFNHFLFVTIIVLAGISFWFSYELRFDFRVPQTFSHQRLFLLPYIAALKVLVFYALRGHRTNWRYIGINDIPVLLLHCVICAIIIYLAPGLVDIWVPRGVILIDFFMSIVLIGGVRLSIRFIREKIRLIRDKKTIEPKKLAIVIGAGDAGEMLIREITRNPYSGIRILALFDDDRRKKGLAVHGIKVIGAVEDVPIYLERHTADMAIIAIPSANKDQMRRIYSVLNKLNIQVKTLPALHEIIAESSALTQLRDINISDLLGREEIQIDTVQVANLITNKVVLVTGAGGSIGSELCRQIIKRKPRRLLLMERSESALFHIHRNLRELVSEDSLVPLLCDFTNRARVFEEFDRYKPELVFHAGAYKHVPMQELNALECFNNNVGGTIILAQAAHEYGVSRFLFVSTDKAVNPTSVMGATKRACEIYCTALGSISKTKFMSVRFGNVLASDGSVIPIFLEQIARGGPITVTHPEMRRYFMTISEAVTLILQAAAIGESGQIMVLDMGKPIKIVDLIEHLLYLVGKSQTYIPIKYVGLRPGEKLFEEICFDSETYQDTVHSKIKIFNQKLTNSKQLLEQIENAAKIISSRRDDQEARVKLKEIVPEYQYHEEEKLDLAVSHG